MIELERIRAAAERIAGHVHRTPLASSASLGARCGLSLHLKCESFQKTGSFKPRGALNKVLTLPEQERRRGLVTVSAGNHAQAVAWAAARTGVPCAVVMPTDAPKSKLDAVRSYGARIVLHDDRPTLFEKLEQVRKETGYSFIHPFDDPETLAGQGTVGLEIVEDFPEVEAVVVPVGGGGLLGGIASAVKQTSPRAKVIAVELEEGPGLAPALREGQPVPVRRPVGTLADGLTPPFVGKLPLEIAREAVDEVVAVSEEAIIEAMRLLMTRAKLYVEGSGAAATAALLSGRARLAPGTRTVAVVSGGNVDLERVCGAVTSPPAHAAPDPSPAGEGWPKAGER